MTRHYWLAKSEPGTYSWQHFERDGRTPWDGVRNFEARNNLRAMREGDEVLFYHSVTGKEIVGVARVVREAYADPSATEGDWSCVDVVPVQALREPVSLATIKADPRLADLALLRRSRLSVVPVSREHFRYILRLGKGQAAGASRRTGPAEPMAAAAQPRSRATAGRKAARPSR